MACGIGSMPGENVLHCGWASKLLSSDGAVKHQEASEPFSKLEADKK